MVQTVAVVRQKRRERMSPEERRRRQREGAAARRQQRAELTPEQRQHLDDVRRSARDSAREVQELALNELDRARAGPRMMAAPPRSHKALRATGRVEHRRQHQGEWDWYDGLSRAEQSRLRENWFSSDPGAASPDEIDERMPINEWLRLTREVDMAKAIETGQHVNRDRYGGKSPSSLIAGEPYDLEVLHGDDRAAHRHIERARQRGRTGAHHVEGSSSRVRFFTDENGIVHPIRASYEGHRPSRETVERYRELDESGAF